MTVDYTKCQKTLKETEKKLQETTRSLRDERNAHLDLQGKFESQLKDRTLIGSMDRENKKLREEIETMRLKMEGLKVQRDTAKEELATFKAQSKRSNNTNDCETMTDDGSFVDEQIVEDKEEVVEEEGPTIYEIECGDKIYYCDDKGMIS